MFNNVIVLAGISLKGEPAASLVWIEENNRMSLNIADNISGQSDLDFSMLINEDEFDANTYNLQVFGIDHHILMMVSAPVITFDFTRFREKNKIADKPTDCRLTAIYKDEKKSEFEIAFSYQIVTDPKGDISIDFPEKVKIYSATQNTIYGYFDSMVGNAPSFKVDLLGVPNAKASVFYADQLTFVPSFEEKLKTFNVEKSEVMSLSQGYYAQMVRDASGNNFFIILKCERNSGKLSLKLKCEKVETRISS